MDFEMYLITHIAPPDIYSTALIGLQS